jgi:hypothetical protein
MTVQTCTTAAANSPYGECIFEPDEGFEDSADCLSLLPVSETLSCLFGLGLTIWQCNMNGHVCTYIVYATSVPFTGASCTDAGMKRAIETPSPVRRKRSTPAFITATTTITNS